MNAGQLEAIEAFAARGTLCDDAEMAARKGSWGGARPGAGRPALAEDEKRVHFNAYLDQDVVDWLHERAAEEEVSASTVANRILRRSMQRQGR
jgi:hypothetical protein